MRSQEEEANGLETLEQIAARIIQKAWRSYVCREVYRYVKSLINQYRQQDPKTALRIVNPREAELLDAPAGVFIRFRLGGVSFPPNIYYKIFTYRPIVDLCASSPRNYVEESKFKPSGDFVALLDRSGWYKRRENNSWRLFCTRTLCTNKPKEIGADKKLDYHHSKLQRRQDVLTWKKRRKIGWLKQMYDKGRSEQGPLEILVENSAKEVIHTFETRGEEEILDWELDELLAWTDTLNFDEYIQEWKQLACSFTSEILCQVHAL